MKAPRILVLSASTGNGHVSAANAIADEAKSRGFHAVAVDTLDFCPRAYKVWYAGGYEMLVRRQKHVWGHFYEVSDQPGTLFEFQDWLDTTMCEGIERLVAQEKPDWVVCTHSLPQPKLAAIRERYGFKMAIVITDLWPHAMWLRGEPDLFFVPQEWTKKELAKREPSFEAKCHVSGMPVHAMFGEQADKSNSRAALELPVDGSLVTIVSGGIGAGPMVRAVRALTKVTDHVVAVAGRNKALHRRLTLAFDGHPQVSVWGHTPQTKMAQTMAASDLLVSKPGGLTTFESLAVGVPMVVFWPFLIPGQEEGNAKYIVESGCGTEAKKLSNLAPVVGELLRDPVKLKAMAEKAKAMGIPDATKRIVDSLVEAT
jgi:processive 1,2-diacylglycerol beta-glucosyltransferase